MANCAHLSVMMLKSLLILVLLSCFQTIVCIEDPDPEDSKKGCNSYSDDTEKYDYENDSEYDESGTSTSYTSDSEDTLLTNNDNSKSEQEDTDDFTDVEDFQTSDHSQKNTYKSFKKTCKDSSDTQTRRKAYSDFDQDNDQGYNDRNPSSISYPDKPDVSDDDDQNTRDNDDCESNYCGKFEVFSNCTNGPPCRNHYCSQFGKPEPCADITLSQCKKGRVCQLEYLRSKNHSCVPIDECDSCGPNEVLSTCVQGDCKAQTCSQIGTSIACPRVIPSECIQGCLCSEGYYRNKYNVCVTKEQCDACGNDNNARPGCGVNCKRHCNDYKSKISLCPRICKVDGCDCKEGYVMDNNINKCVLPDQCTSETCPAGEVFSTCPPGNPKAEYCPVNRNDYEIYSTTKECGKPRCICGFNQRRDPKSKKCIPATQCPPFPCDGINEVYKAIVSPFYKQNCSNYLYNTTYPKFGRIGIVITYNPECICKENFYRNSNNTCVDKSECEKCKGDNEFWDPCAPTCPPQTCDSIGKRYNCPLQRINASCVGACRCALNFYRNKSNICVSEKQCKTTQLQCSRKNEVYACGSACQARCSEIVNGKLPTCPIINIRCNDACYCIDGYARDDNDNCIPIEECPNVCGLNEEYSTCTNALCRHQNCTEKGSAVSCPRLLPGACTTGCVCKPGYLRDADGTCISEDQCNTCGSNEVLDKCINGGCTPKKCSQIGTSIPCPKLRPSACRQGCVCRKDYLRARNDTCVPRNQCDACGGDLNARPGCGSNCNNHCNDDKSKPRACALVCKVDGCDCQNGYVFDNNQGKCVQPKDCTKVCGLNEEFSTCTNALCRHQNCTEKGSAVSCPRLLPGACTTGCVCKPGYLRATNGTCIIEDQCDKECPKGETFSECPPLSTKQEYCPTSESDVGPFASNKACGAPRCVCEFYQRRDRTGKCIPAATCPPFPCDRPNEVYQARSSPFYKQNCINYLHNTTLPRFRIGIVIQYNPKCICKPNHYRNSNGTCVDQSECERCQGDNEYYNPCRPACSPQTCESIGKRLFCPRIPVNATCVEECRCNTNFYRNGSNICVPKDQCKRQETTTLAPPGDEKGDDNNTGDSDIDSDNISDDLQQSFAEGLFKFSVNFLLKATENSKKSAIMSPFSLDILLRELAPFVCGDTLKQLRNALSLENTKQLNIMIPTTLKMIKTQQNVTSDIASKIYANIKFELTRDFLDYTKKYFDAEAENLDFSNPSQAVQIINKWVEDVTRNRIKNLLSRDMISDLTRLIMVNAVYFKGNWKDKFDIKNTKNQTFYMSENKTVQKPMMYRKIKVKYIDDMELGAQIIEKPYINENFSMVVILPHKIDGLKEVTEKLVNYKLKKLSDSFKMETVQIYLPKMEIETTLDLKSIMQKQGIQNIFVAAKSCLTNIIKGNETIFVSDAVQKAFVKVNEEGAEAAAATALIFRTTAVQSANPPKDIMFKADHPFLMLIKFKNLSLFIGNYWG